jgi:nucleoside-diphosphate kinase
MKGTITFSMIKPDAVANGYTGEMLKIISDAGFRIMAMQQKRMSAEMAMKFYDVHKTKSFFGELIEYMTSGPIVALVLQKEGAVEDFRKLIGATDPAVAAPGTLRNLFAKSISANAVHGSDSDEHALREAYFHFSGSEIFDEEGHCIALS